MEQKDGETEGQAGKKALRPQSPESRSTAPTTRRGNNNNQRLGGTLQGGHVSPARPLGLCKLTDRRLRISMTPCSASSIVGQSFGRSRRQASKKTQISKPPRPPPLPDPAIVAAPAVAAHRHHFPLFCPPSSAQLLGHDIAARMVQGRSTGHPPPLHRRTCALCPDKVRLG